MADVKLPEFVTPDWPAAENIRAACTTRVGGYSQSPCDGFNLGLHVGDKKHHVASNRKLLIDSLSLPDAPFYLNQVHGTQLLCADDWTDQHGGAPIADACWSQSRNRVLAIMTADCLPVLFTSGCGSVIAGAHAGWRGLAEGVIENTVSGLPVPAAELMAWLGPAIGPDKFEVGAEVKASFVSRDEASAKHFAPLSVCDESASTGGKYLANLYGLARDKLHSLGVSRVYGGDECTYTDAGRFFSHRRDKGKTGRMAALIWKV